MKLGPEHYVDLVGKPNLLAKVLANKDAANAWHDAIEDEKKLSQKDIESLQSIPNNPNLIKTMDPLLVAQGINSLITATFVSWKVNSYFGAKVLAASAPIFVELSKTTPEINPSTEYKFAYRGTSLDEDELDRFIEKTKTSDWKKVKIKRAGITLMTKGTAYYRLYTGPKGSQYLYKPHSNVQSWSVKAEVAACFGHHVLVAPLDKTFFFDPKFLGNYGPSAAEMETIHFGKQPMKVAILVNDQMFPFDRMPDNDDKIPYTQF